MKGSLKSFSVVVADDDEESLALLLFTVEEAEADDVEEDLLLLPLPTALNASEECTPLPFDAGFAVVLPAAEAAEAVEAAECVCCCCICAPDVIVTAARFCDRRDIPKSSSSSSAATAVRLTISLLL